MAEQRNSIQPEGQQQQQQQQDNMWNEILKESELHNKFVPKQVLVFGARNSGKRSLLDSLHKVSGTEFPKKGQNDLDPGKLKQKLSTAPLDYVYLNVRNFEDKEFDTKSRVGFYVFNSEKQKNLLKNALANYDVQKTMVVIVLDFAEPWNFIDQINKWIGMVSQCLESLELKSKTYDQMRENVTKIVRYWQTWKLKSEAKAADAQGTSTEDGQTQVEVPLGEGLLQNNIGLPLLVVCNKAEIIENMDQKKVEFIEYHLRKICINYGAALVYSSVKNCFNLDIIYEYIVSVLYDQDLPRKPETNTHESLFLPAGFDNLTLLRSLFSSIDTNQHYQEVVVPPEPKQQQKQEIYYVDEQLFLKQLKEQFGASQSTGQRAPVSGIPGVGDAASRQQAVQQSYLMSSLRQQTQSQQQAGQQQSGIGAQSGVPPLGGAGAGIKTASDGEGGAGQPPTQMQNFYVELMKKQNFLSKGTSSTAGSAPANQNDEVMKQKANDEILRRIQSSNTTAAARPTGGVPKPYNESESRSIQDLLNRGRPSTTNQPPQQQ